MICVTCGMVPGGNVHDALERILRMRGEDWVAVIRSIDSARSQDHLRRSLATYRVPYEVTNGNVCVSIDALQKALGEGAFTGFDEVWIADGKPPAFDLASFPSATSDGADFSLNVPHELSRAMEDANCILIVGDGCGLNYATTSQEFQEAIA